MSISGRSTLFPPPPRINVCMSVSLSSRAKQKQKQSTATATATVTAKGQIQGDYPNSELLQPEARSLNPVATGITSHTTTSPAPATPSKSPTSTTTTPTPTLPKRKSLSIMSMSMSAFTTSSSSGNSTRSRSSTNPSIKTKSSESSSKPPPRPRSPPSMYHMYAMDAPRVPKPLVKIPPKEGKGKGKGKDKADNLNESTSTLGTISSFGSHRSSSKGKGTGLPSIIPIPAKFGFRRTSSVGRMQAPTPTPSTSNQNQNQNDRSHHSAVHPPPQPSPPPAESGTPISPAFPVQSEEEIRKKRMERVERTFGEHVPSELVFPDEQESQQQHQQHQHQERLWRELDLNAKDLERVYRAKQRQEGKAVRRASISVATFASFGNLKRTASSIGRASTRTHSRGSSRTSESNDHEVVSTPPNPNPDFEIKEERRGIAVPSKTGITTNSVPRPLPPVPTGAAMGYRASKEHSETETKPYQASPRTEPVRFQARQSSLIARTKSLSHPSLPFNASLPRPSSPFVDNLVPIPRSHTGNGNGNGDGSLVPPGMELVEGTVVRRERKQGWSGEWNRGDMQDVIQKLRALK